MSRWTRKFTIALFGTVVVSFLLLNGCGGSGGTTGGGGAAAPVPGPQISSISPAALQVGASATQITITGSNFQNSSTALWNGTALATTFVASTQLQATVPANGLTAAGNIPVTVSNGTTVSASVLEPVNNPAPSLGSMSPTSVAAGTGAVTLTITSISGSSSSSGTAFVPASVVMWNNTALATTLVSPTTLTAKVPASFTAAADSAQISVTTPKPGGGTTAIGAFYVLSSSTTTAYVDAIAWNLAWDSAHNRIYASIPRFTYGSGVYSGNLIAIDPIAANVVAQVTAGSGPDQIALSPDNSFLWLSEAGATPIQRFSLPGLTADRLIASPTLSPGTSSFIYSIQIDPANSNALAVSYNDRITIIDGTTPRAQLLLGLKRTDADWIQWGPDSNTLYGSASGADPDESYAYTVDSSGFTGAIDQGYLFRPYQGFTHYDKKTGYLYHDNGQILDPATGEMVGQFDLSRMAGTLCLVDSDQGVAFFLGQLVEPPGLGGQQSIQVFDQKSYALLRTIVVPNSVSLQGDIAGFIRWGKAGLAFSVLHPSYVTTGKIGGTFLVDGSFVNPTAVADVTYATPIQPLPVVRSVSPTSAAAGSSDLTITVTGSGFESGSQVTSGAMALPTTFIGPGTLRAVIPASQLKSVGSHFIAVNDGDGSSLDVGTLQFSVTPSGMNLTVLGLNALGLAWDAKSNLLYAGVGGSDPLYPDSVVGIDPTTGIISRTQSAVTDPTVLRTTSDGSYLYVASMTSNLVAQLPLATFETPSIWRVGRGPFSIHSESFYASDLQPAPGAPTTVAVSLAWPNSIPHHLGGIRIFDNGIARPTAATPVGAVNYDQICWGADSSTLYAVEGDTDYHLFQLAVDGSGVSLQNSHSVNYANIGGQHFDAKSGHIFDDAGDVVNPADGSRIVNLETTGPVNFNTNNGPMIINLESSGLVAIDSTLNRVYVLGQTLAQEPAGSFTIEAFDMTTYTSLGSVVVPNVLGYPHAFVRWGSSGLAFSTFNSYSNLVNQPMGALYILNNPSFSSVATQSTVGPAHEPLLQTWKRLTPSDFSRQRGAVPAARAALMKKMNSLQP